MEKKQTEVQKFLTETQRQIDEEGLVAMSGTDFSRGDPLRRVLKAKQAEYRLNSGGLMDIVEVLKGNIPKIKKGKHASVALIAQDLNALVHAAQVGDVLDHLPMPETEVDPAAKQIIGKAVFGSDKL